MMEKFSIDKNNGIIVIGDVTIGVDIDDVVYNSDSRVTILLGDESYDPFGTQRIIKHFNEMTFHKLENREPDTPAARARQLRKNILGPRKGRW